MNGFKWNNGKWVGKRVTRMLEQKCHPEKAEELLKHTQRKPGQGLASTREADSTMQPHLASKRFGLGPSSPSWAAGLPLPHKFGKKAAPWNHQVLLLGASQSSSFSPSCSAWKARHCPRPLQLLFPSAQSTIPYPTSYC